MKCARVVLLLASASLANATAILTTSAGVSLTVPAADGFGYVEVAGEQLTANPSLINIYSPVSQSSGYADAMSSYNTLSIHVATGALNNGSLELRPAYATATAYASDTLYFSEYVSILHLEYAFAIQNESTTSEVIVGGLRLGKTGCCGDRSPVNIPVDSTTVAWSALLTARAESFGRGPCCDNGSAEARIVSISLRDADGNPLSGMTYSSDSGNQYNILNATSTVPEPSSWVLLAGGLSFGLLLKARLRGWSRRHS